MPFPPIQRYLGWLQRFLYQVEVPLPFKTSDVVVPTLDINYDWPLEIRYGRFTYATIVGSVATPLINNTSVSVFGGKPSHFLVIFCEGGTVAGTNLPAGDIVSLQIGPDPPNAPVGQSALWQNRGLGLPTWGMINSVAGTAAIGMGSSFIPAVYVPCPGHLFQVVHTSGAAGLNCFVNFSYIPLPAYSPHLKCW